jgi:hypothetical protein
MTILGATILSITRLHSTIMGYVGIVQRGRESPQDGSSTTLWSRITAKRITGQTRKQISSDHPRVVFVDGNAWTLDKHAKKPSRIIQYPIQLRHRDIPAKGENNAVSSDVKSKLEGLDRTRFYPVGDSQDDFPDMERRQWPNHEFDPQHCHPAAAWQSNFYPVCNDIHAVADLGQSLIDEDLVLLSNRGFWRQAWKHHPNSSNAQFAESATVWKTFKYVSSGPRIFSLRKCPDSEHLTKKYCCSRLLCPIVPTQDRSQL